jgi:predicted PurR-regulated permease PerM
VLSVLATVFVLDWAEAVFIPLVLAAIISYALAPPLRLLRRWHVPQVLGALLLLGVIVGAGGSLAYSLRGEAAGMIETLPQAAKKLRRTLQKEIAGLEKGAIGNVQEAAAQIERAARETAAEPSVPRGVTRVQIEEPKFSLEDYLWNGTLGALSVASLAVMVLFLAFFMMISGDIYRRKLVLIAGPTFSKKKITVQVLNEISVQIQRYLLVQVFAGVVVGVATWAAFSWIGVENAAFWGVVAAVLNVIPYLGAVLVAGAAALVGLLQFGSVGMALTVGGISLAINSLEGYLLMPWLTGRANRMNAVVIFVGVLFWGWLWGAWGLLLGMPIMIAMKSVCDHIEDFKSVGELMGD